MKERTTYCFGNRSFVVESVFKEESPDTLGSVPLRLMKAEHEKLHTRLTRSEGGKRLTKVAKEKGYTHLVYFLDDGVSGVTMDRPNLPR